MFEKMKDKMNLKKLYKKKLEEINGVWDYSYEDFLKNVKRSEKNAEIGTIFKELLDKTYSQNENLKEYLNQFEPCLSYYSEFENTPGMHCDYDISRYDDKQNIIEYKIIIKNGQIPFAEINFNVSYSGEIISIDAKYTHAAEIHINGENRYDKYTISNINEEAATVEKESLKYDENYQKYITNDTFEVQANTLSK